MERKKRAFPPVIKIDGEAEVKIIAPTCDEPPAGRSRWPLQLPADTAKEWCIPEASAEFVERMEDILKTYTPPYDPARPVVCLDETSRQLIGETKTPLPVRPGQPGIYDYDYVRKGAADLFMMVEPPGCGGKLWSVRPAPETILPAVCGTLPGGTIRTWKRSFRLWII
jgi:hypothetical protein